MSIGLLHLTPLFLILGCREQTVDIDFNNIAGFAGQPAELSDAPYIVYYLSHAMLFCTGALIEGHVVITPASCVIGEKYKFEVFGGTHTFVESVGNPKRVQHMCTHQGYNHTHRWKDCSTDNLALLLLDHQYLFHEREPHTEFVVSRVRYGSLPNKENDQELERLMKTCSFFGWGSRRNVDIRPASFLSCGTINRAIQGIDGGCLVLHHPRSRVGHLDLHIPMDLCNATFIYTWNQCFPSPLKQSGYLVPVLTKLRRVDVRIMEDNDCRHMWNHKNKYLCLSRLPCSDDLGSVLVCSGFLRGMMTSLLMDRPCGVGFLDLNNYNKFLTCGVDDSRDLIGFDDLKLFDFSAAGGQTSEPHTWITMEPGVTTDQSMETLNGNETKQN